MVRCADVRQDLEELEYGMESTPEKLASANAYLIQTMQTSCTITGECSSMAETFEAQNNCLILNDQK